MFTRLKVKALSALDLIQNAREYRQIAESSAAGLNAIGIYAQGDEMPADTIVRGFGDISDKFKSVHYAYRTEVGGLKFAARVQSLILEKLVARNIEMTEGLEDILEGVADVRSPNGTTKKIVRQIEEVLAGPVQEEEAEEPMPADVADMAAVEREVLGDECATQNT